MLIKGGLVVLPDSGILFYSAKKKKKKKKDLGSLLLLYS